METEELPIAMKNEEEMEGTVPAAANMIDAIPATSAVSTNIKQQQQQQQPEAEMQAEEEAENASHDEQHVISALFAVAATNDVLLEIDRCICMLAEMQRERQEEMEIAEECEQMDSTLREEHRLHQEELALINQDMKQLDSIVRSLRTQRAHHAPELDRRLAEFDAKLTALENGIDAKIVCDHPQTATVVGAASAAPNSNFPPIGGGQFHMFLTFFHQLQLLQHQQQQQLQQQQQSGGHWQMVPPTARHIVVPNAPQQAKMKACQHCLKEIHRNAPTCPFCKQKITSKAAKRTRKKQQ